MATRNIFRYSVPIESKFYLDLPLDAKILSARLHDGRCQLWVLVPARAPHYRRLFRLFETEAAIENPGEVHFIATLHLADQDLTYHLFETET